MSPTEMRRLASELQSAVWGDEVPSMINKLCSVVWFAAAEICERLDALAESASNANRETPIRKH